MRSVLSGKTRAAPRARASPALLARGAVEHRGRWTAFDVRDSVVRMAAKKKGASSAARAATSSKRARRTPAPKKAARKSAKKAGKKTTEDTGKATAEKAEKKKTAMRKTGREVAKPRGTASASARADIVERLKHLIKSTVSEARERTKWRMPVYSLGRDFCYVGWSPKGVSLGFFRGAELPDPDSLLQGAGRRLRVVRIQAAQEISEPALRRLIEAAAQLAAG